MIKTLASLILGATLATGQTTFSERLAKISNYLGKGGVHYAITDHEGDLQKGAQFLNELMSLAEDIPVEANFDKLGKELGLYSILGTGASSAKKAHHWHNRNFLLTDGKHDALLSLFGPKASPPIAFTFAPEGADIVFETEIDLRQLEQTAKNSASDFGNEAVDTVSGFFAETINGGKNMSHLLKDFTVRLAVVAWFDESKKVELMPGLELPSPHLVVRLDRAKGLWEAISDDIKKDSEIVKKDDEVTYLSEKEETPFGTMRPQITWIEKTQQLWFSLSSDSLSIARGKGNKLDKDSHFITASKGLSTETNVNGYLSARAIELIFQGAQLGSAMNPEAAPFVNFIVEILSQADSPHGYAMTVKVQKDGILSISNAAYTNKGGNLAGPQSIETISLLDGLATPAILKAKKNATKAKEINNIRQLLMAVTGYDADQGEYPAELVLLEKEGHLEKGMLDALAAPGLVYRGKEIGSTVTATSNDILMYLEMPGLDKVIYGKADGSVGESPLAKLPELLKKK